MSFWRRRRSRKGRGKSRENETKVNELLQKEVLSFPQHLKKGGREGGMEGGEEEGTK